MINEIEYISPATYETRRIRADKAVNERGAWHLSSIDGNGLPDVETLGSSSFGVAGKSYMGLSVSDRTIVVKMYADAYSAAGLQHMLEHAARCVSLNWDALGILRLKNAAGEWYRIGAKCVNFEVEKDYRRTALVRMDFYCPHAWFEDDAPTRVPLIAVSGGKEYINGKGLERPYMFGDSDAVDNTSSGDSMPIKLPDVRVTNRGDVACPIRLSVFGAGFKTLVIGNRHAWEFTLTNPDGKSMPQSIEVSSDIDNLGCLGDGRDYSEAIDMANSAPLADLVLQPGANVIYASMKTSRVTVAGTELTFRGRYSACL